MAQFPKSFEVYGFTIEVHAGGRRVWPPSFKRFVKEGLDSGKLALADVKASRIRTTTVTEDAFFSEVVIDEDQPASPLADPARDILLRGREIEIALPSTYPVSDLIKVILSLESRT